MFKTRALLIKEVTNVLLPVWTMTYLSSEKAAFGIISEQRTLRMVIGTHSIVKGKMAQGTVFALKAGDMSSSPA